MRVSLYGVVETIGVLLVTIYIWFLWAENVYPYLFGHGPYWTSIAQIATVSIATFNLFLFFGVCNNSSYEERKKNRIPKVIYECKCCNKCGKARLHRILLSRGKELSSDCIVCEIGEEKHKVITNIMKGWGEEDDKRFSDMTVEEREAYVEMSQEERKLFREEWRKGHE